MMSQVLVGHHLVIGFFFRAPCIDTGLADRHWSLGCQDAYYLSGLSCYARTVLVYCPKNYYRTGLLCQVKTNSPVTSVCDGNGCWDNHAWWGDGITVAKPSYNRGVGIIPGCGSGYKSIAGLCYRDCDPGCSIAFDFAFVAICLCDVRCPTVGSTNYVKCGFGCGNSGAICSLIIADQIMSTVFLMINAATLYFNWLGPAKSGAQDRAKELINEALSSNKLKSATTEAIQAVDSQLDKIQILTKVVEDAVAEIASILAKQLQKFERLVIALANEISAAVKPVIQSAKDACLRLTIKMKELLDRYRTKIDQLVLIRKLLKEVKRGYAFIDTLIIAGGSANIGGILGGMSFINGLASFSPVILIRPMTLNNFES